MECFYEEAYQYRQAVRVGYWTAMKQVAIFCVMLLAAYVTWNISTGVVS